MYAGNTVRLISFFSFLLEFSMSQSDQDFCNRLYHSTVVANNKLYVDGGEIRTITQNNVNVGIPDTIDTIDLSKPFSNTDPSIWGHISKKTNNSGTDPPTLNDGSMFATNSSLYLFGGALSAAPGAPAVAPANGIWQYHLSGNQSWVKANIAPSGFSPERIHWGLAVQAIEKFKGYFLGGAIAPKSDPAFNALPNAKPYMVQGLITLDEQSIDFANTTTTGLNSDGTTLGGFVALIESLGSGGVLVAFGGVSNTPGKPMELDDADLADPELHSQMGNISVYDIGTQTWYQQAATGDVPPWRYVGCSVVVSAPDRSSHSIFVFGGWGNTLAGSDGNVFVLSLPSFRWIRVNTESNRRARHQCNLIGKNTMLVVGGVQSNGGGLQPTGVSGCDTDTMFAQGLGMFSLNNMTWTTSYDPSNGEAAYQIHPSISHIIGGNEDGGAILQAPEKGFSQRALGKLLGAHQQSNKGSESPNSGTGGKAKFDPAIIAGVAVAAFTSFVFLFVFVLFMQRRRRRPTHYSHNPSRPSISAPVLVTRTMSELSSDSSAYISNGKGVPFEMASPDRSFPHQTYEKKLVRIQEITELEGEGSCAAELTVAESDRKARIRENTYI